MKFSASFSIGSTESECFDYAAKNSFSAVLAAGSSKHFKDKVSVGVRLLVQSVLNRHPVNELVEIAIPFSDLNAVFKDAVSSAANVGLSDQCLSASLMVLRNAQYQAISFCGVGDNTLIARTRNGIWEIYITRYPGPFYVTTACKELDRSAFIERYWNLCGVCFIDSVQWKSSTRKFSLNDSSVVWQNFPVEKYDLVMAFSRGSTIEQINSLVTTGRAEELISLLKRMCVAQNPESDSFMKRHMDNVFCGENRHSISGISAYVA